METILDWKSWGHEPWVFSQFAIHLLCGLGRSATRVLIISFLSIKLGGGVLWNFSKIKEISVMSLSTRWWAHDDEDGNNWYQIWGTRFYSGNLCTKFHVLTIHKVNIIFPLFWYGNGSSEYWRNLLKLHNQERNGLCVPQLSTFPVKYVKYAYSFTIMYSLRKKKSLDSIFYLKIFLDWE